jgi:hypothetical protein
LEVQVAQGGGGYGGGGYGGGPPGYGGHGGPPGQGGPPGYGGHGGPPNPWGPPGAPPPGGGPAPAPPGQFPQQPKRKSNTLLFVGLGCGALGLIAVAIAAFIFIEAKRRYDEVSSTVASALSSVAAPVASNAPGGGAPVAGACGRALACCRAIVEKSTTAQAAETRSQALKACDNFLTPGILDATCQQALDGYRSTASVLGARCD